MSIRRVVCFRARGNKLMEFVNDVRNSYIICFSQKISYEEYTGRVYISDLETLKELALKTGTDLFIDNYEGKMFKVLRYKARYGIFAGVLFMCAFIYIMSNIVVRIEINGNENISDDEILSVLSEIGIENGKFIPSIDFEQSEIRMKTRLGNISWGAIRHRGGRVIVDVHEAVEKPGTVHNNIPCNIISDRDALIVKMNVKQGKAAVGEGYSVGKGDLLVSGITDNGESNYIIVHSLADIIGEYKEEQRFVEYFQTEEKVYTETISQKYIEFFGFRIPVFLGGTCKKTADYEESTEYVSVLGIKIPIGLVCTEYKVFEMQNIVSTEEQAIKKIEEQIARYERNFYNDKEIVNKEKQKYVYDDYVEYVVSYTVRGKIGYEKELFISKN